MPVRILSVGFSSANVYVVGSRAESMLMVDCGWPNRMRELLANLERNGLSLRRISHLLVTHYHPDHSGLARELEAAGIGLAVLETQVPSERNRGGEDELTRRYVEMHVRAGRMLRKDQARAFLSELGLDGDILPTPGHSFDSVTLLLDEGAAFTGDLPYRETLSDSDGQSRASWELIRARGARMVYPGHGKPYAI
jgi:endoribonuclease LACTB2